MADSQVPWVLVAADDRLIPPPAQRATSERSGSTVTEVPGSHAVHVSDPAAVAGLIARAAKAVSSRWEDGAAVPATLSPRSEPATVGSGRVTPVPTTTCQKSPTGPGLTRRRSRRQAGRQADSCADPRRMRRRLLLERHLRPGRARIQARHQLGTPARAFTRLGANPRTAPATQELRARGRRGPARSPGPDHANPNLPT